jgi:hypothetical protein
MFFYPDERDEAGTVDYQVGAQFRLVPELAAFLRNVFCIAQSDERPAGHGLFDHIR